MNELESINELEESVANFLNSLRRSNTAGQYFPCLEGRTPYGEDIELGPSCFALKIFHTFGWWQELSEKERQEWIAHINSFMMSSKSVVPWMGFVVTDKALVDFLSRPSFRRTFSRIQSASVRELVRKGIRKEDDKSEQKAIVAETKQSLATLAVVGVSLESHFSNFALAPENLSQKLYRYDWSLPWGAGGQAAALAVFVSLAAKEEPEGSHWEPSREVMRQFFRHIVDTQTGAYFTGSMPNKSMLVNGAMKVLTALDWLEEPIHYPDRLIDTVLQHKPRREGCDIVDAIYVLYRCSQRKDYRYQEICDYFVECLELIFQHRQPDGGFSFSRDRAQKWYYGMPISKGLKEGDIHGTTLLVWAVSMIVQYLRPDEFHWNILKP